MTARMASLPVSMNWVGICGHQRQRGDEQHERDAHGRPAGDAGAQREREHGRVQALPDGLGQLAVLVDLDVHLAHEEVGQHRDHGQGHEQRRQQGERDGQREGQEELADDAAHEAERQEHRHGREGAAGDGAGHLAGARQHGVADGLAPARGAGRCSRGPRWRRPRRGRRRPPGRPG